MDFENLILIFIIILILCYKYNYMPYENKYYSGSEKNNVFCKTLIESGNVAYEVNRFDKKKVIYPLSMDVLDRDIRDFKNTDIVYTHDKDENGNYKVIGKVIDVFMSGEDGFIDKHGRINTRKGWQCIYEVDEDKLKQYSLNLKDVASLDLSTSYEPIMEYSKTLYNGIETDGEICGIIPNNVALVNKGRYRATQNILDNSLMPKNNILDNNNNVINVDNNTMQENNISINEVMQRLEKLEQLLQNSEDKKEDKEEDKEDKVENKVEDKKEDKKEDKEEDKEDKVENKVEDKKEDKEEDKEEGEKEEGEGEKEDQQTLNQQDDNVLLNQMKEQNVIDVLEKLKNILLKEDYAWVFEKLSLLINNNVNEKVLEKVSFNNSSIEENNTSTNKNDTDNNIFDNNFFYSFNW